LHLKTEQPTRGKRDDYYRAFTLVTGLLYDDPTWDTQIGVDWRSVLSTTEYVRLRAMPTRRRTGRKKGVQNSPHSTVTSGNADKPFSDDPGAQLEEQETLLKLYNLLRKGIQVRTAVAQCDLGQEFAKNISADPSKLPEILHNIAIYLGLG